MNKYKVAAIICALLAVACAAWAILGSRLSGNGAAETPPPNTQAAEETKAPAENTAEDADSKAEKTEETEDKKESSEEASDYQSPIDFQALQEENPDIYGWLTIEGSDISYPILQSRTDDSFYLDHDRSGEKDIAGSLFSEHLYNGTDMTDPVTIIYGHHMKNGSMFGNLQKLYSSAKTYEACRQITVYLPDREIHYEVFAAVPYDARHVMLSFDFTSEDGMYYFLKSLQGTRAISATYEEDRAPVEGESVLVLCTCLQGDQSRRYLVCAKEVAEEMTEDGSN